MSMLHFPSARVNDLFEHEPDPATRREAEQKPYDTLARNTKTVAERVLAAWKEETTNRLKQAKKTSSPHTDFDLVAAAYATLWSDKILDDTMHHIMGFKEDPRFKGIEDIFGEESLKNLRSYLKERVIDASLSKTAREDSQNKIKRFASDLFKK